MLITTHLYKVEDVIVGSHEIVLVSIDALCDVSLFLHP
jgi:hypothetical protein